MKRVKKVNKDPNPLFMQWLKEFREEALRKENSGLVKVYNMCIENLSRFPLTLDTGAQCKVLTGFGKTICSRLDQKLSQHQEKLVSDTESSSLQQLVSSNNLEKPLLTELQFPVSPVLLPTGQLQLSPVRHKEVNSIASSSQERLSYNSSFSPRKSPLYSQHTSPPKSPPYSPPKSAIFDLSPEVDLRTQEEKDIELAMALSQVETAEVSKYIIDDDGAGVLQTQEELDHQFALKLQAEMNGDNDSVPSSKIRKRDMRSRDTPPPPAFTFDTDYQVARRLSQADLSDGDDLPDISLTRDTPTLTPPPSETSSKSSAPQRAVPNHDLSESDEEEIDNVVDPLDKLFQNDPVFNLSKKKTKEKSKFNKSLTLKDKTDPSVSIKTPTRVKKVVKVETPNTPTSTTKAYVPKARTGAYAVLLTLYNHSTEDSYPGYLTKAVLCEAAQPLADQSFTLASVRVEHYTAWSGVQTLLKHGLVVKWSNPAKFNITDKGKELASRIVMTEGIEEDTVDKNMKRPSEEDLGQNKRRKRDLSGQKNVGKDINEEEIRKKRLAKFSNQSLDFERDCEEFGGLVGTPSNMDDLEYALELSRREAEASICNNQTKTTDKRGLGVSGANFDLGGSFSMEQTLNEEDFAIPGTSNLYAVPETAQKSTNSPSLTTSSSLPLPLALQSMYRCQMSSAAPAVDRHSPDFVLKGGSFEILLCVDNTEIAGGGVGGRKTLKVETVRHLQQCRVEYDMRNLNIGDFLWIARERVGEVQGQFRQRQPRELVLPFIVERKRLDDLWMSVKDGRYEEQKFRMKGCGLVHLYYLIEDHPGQKQFWGRAGNGGVLVTPEAIEQAIANTAVQEGFTVKKTADQKETIQYLTLFTRLLREKYKNLDLTSCTNSDMADGLVGSRDTTLLNFQEFNDSSKKNKQLTVSEVFAKMLLRLKGLSVEMAQTIVRMYPTPRDLMSAYNASDNAVERVRLIADLQYGMEGKRKIPKAVAEALMKFWTSPNLI